jgi:hypothetical protein
MYTSEQFRSAVADDVDYTWIEDLQTGIKIYMTPRAVKRKGLDRLKNGEPVKVILELKEECMLPLKRGGRKVFRVTKDIREPLNEEEHDGASIMHLRADRIAEVIFPLAPM